jgi:PEP-CTERM motif-containing protein
MARWLPRLASTLLVLVPLAAPAHATPFQATLSLVLQSAIGSLGAMSFVGSASGSSAPTHVTAPSGIFAGSALLPVAGVASLSAVSVQGLGNRAGQFNGEFLRGGLGISGSLRLKGDLGAGPTTLANVPLHFTEHVAGSAALSQGFGRCCNGHDAGFVAEFGYWRTSRAYVQADWGRKYVYSYHLPAGKAASRRSFSNHTGATGSDTRTPGGLGQLTLVSPIRIRTNLPGSDPLLVVFGMLTLNFVPEPATLVLLGAGAAALGFLGRGRLHRR